MTEIMYSSNLLLCWG